MENSIVENNNAAASGRTRSKRSAAVVAGLVILFGGGLLYGLSGWWGRITATADQTPTYEAERAPLLVTVSAGGTLQAMRSHEVASQVEGTTQILSVIPEGTIITEQDVENQLVLMELDASQARERVEQQEITVQDASAALTQAEEDYTIQREQNESDVAQAELRVRFALMELQRYLGDDLAARAADRQLDFEERRWRDDIGGAALLERRRLENAVSLAGEELSRTRESLHWTRELVERGYVNRNELVADELEEKRRTVNLESAEETLALFLRYTLVKEAEERLSDYIEAKRNLERTRARARGRMVQAEADLRSRRASYELQKERLRRLHQMIENSTVVATRPGMVVYASTTDPRRFRNSPVQEGLSVREGQTLLTIPDLSRLAARVEVSETHAQMVREGQVATISLDAKPDTNWRGEVRRISPMATQQWGLRALAGGSGGYETDVAFVDLDANHHDLKPGMTATVEIEVASIPQALSVPIHAVHTRDGRRVCWVATVTGPAELREVELGLFTDTHVQIRRGLQDGERVMLTRPLREPRDLRMVALPELPPEQRDDEDTPDMNAALSRQGASVEADEGVDQIEQWMNGLDPEIRRRLERRMQNPEEQERMLERLQDPAAREQMLRRMQQAPPAGRGQRRGE